MTSLVGALRAMLSLDSTEFVKGSTKAQAATKKLEGGLTSLSGRMKAVSAPFAVAAAAISGGLFVAARNGLRAADEMGEMAERIGVPVEELSRLAYAAKITGVPLETLEKSLGQLSKKMVAASQGGSPAKMFSDLGVAVVDANGKIRDTEAVLQDLAERFAAMPDGAEKTALAMQMFGKSGTEMLLMLNSGGDGLRRLTEEARALGMEIDAQTAESAGKFGDNMERLKTAASGIGLYLAAQLAQPLEDFTNFIVELPKSFPKFVDDLGIIFNYAGMKLQETINGWSKSVDDFLGHVQRVWGEIKGAIGGAISYVIGLWDGFIAKLTAGVEAAKVAGQAIADALSAGQAEMNSGTGYGGMVGAGDEFGTGMFGAGQEGANGLINGLTDGVVQRQGEIDQVANGITKRVRDIWQIQSPSKVFQAIGQFLSEGLSVGITEGKPKVDAAMDEVGASIEGKADSFKSAFESMRSTLGSTFTGLVSGALSFKDALSQVIGKLAEMLAQSAFEGLMGSGGDGILGGILGLFGFAKGGAFAGGRALAFAKGGVVSGATAFGMQGGLGVMGEAGPEAIMPLARGRGGKLGVVAQGGGANRVQIEITENPMFAARVEGIADGRAVQVVRKYDREVVPTARNRSPRERG